MRYVLLYRMCVVVSTSPIVTPHKNRMNEPPTHIAFHSMSDVGRDCFVPKQLAAVWTVQPIIVTHHDLKASHMCRHVHMWYHSHRLCGTVRSTRRLCDTHLNDAAAVCRCFDTAFCFDTHTQHIPGDGASDPGELIACDHILHMPCGTTPGTACNACRKVQPSASVCNYITHNAAHGTQH